jgi:hypothetical protein
MDYLDATGSIYTFCTRLRALWREFSVEVRVLSGASKGLEITGFRSDHSRLRADSWQRFGNVSLRHGVGIGTGTRARLPASAITPM